MKINRKFLREIIKEVGILHHLGLTDDEPYDGGMSYFTARTARLKAADEWADSDDYDDGHMDEEDDEPEDDDILQERDLGTRNDGVDINWQFQDGSSFYGDLEDVSPEEAFTVGYKMSEEHPEYGIEAIDGKYPRETITPDGRMFDYGHSKSDSHEGRMTKAKLFRMAQMAQSLEHQLHDGDDLPGWVQDKVTTAEDRLRSAHDYMDYKIRRMKQQGERITESKVRREVRKYLLNT